MKNSYTQIHYNEKLRPYTKYPPKLCKYWADKYFKASSGKLLDVCCGRGEHMEIFKKMGFDVYGVDMDTIAKDKGLSVEICEVGIDKLPYPNDFFDFIIMKSAIEHIRNIYPAMEELYRVLKKGGKILITTCDYKKQYKTFYNDVDHKTPFTKWSLFDLLLRYDFKNVNVETFYQLPFTWKGNILKIIPYIISYLIPIDYPVASKYTTFNKLIRFSRCREILGYGIK